MNIRICESKWLKLHNILDQSFDKPNGKEWGAIGFIKKSGENFLIVDIVPPEENDIINSEFSFCFTTQYIRKEYLLAQEACSDGLAFFHTHPFANDHVSFSSYDNEEEPKLMANLNDLWPNSTHIGLVIGKKSLQARTYFGLEVKEAENFMIVGKTIKIIPATGHPRAASNPADLFDRANAITDKGSLHDLGILKIAIVGLGGTGSLLFELLTRTGCRKLVIIDDDKVEASNLNRLLHGSLFDAKHGIKKVAVAARANYLNGFELQLEIKDLSVTDKAAQAALLGADFIMGCVDNDTARAIMNGIAVKYAIPYIDLGTEIGIGKIDIQSMDARVTYIYPEGPCLSCRGLIRADRLRLEGLQPEERGRQIKLGYCENIELIQPAVMELNMRAASLASLLIRHLLQPFLDSSMEMDFREGLLTLSHRQPLAKSMSTCVCSQW